MTFNRSATNSGSVFMCESPSEEQLRPIVQANRGERRRRVGESFHIRMYANIPLAVMGKLICGNRCRQDSYIHMCVEVRLAVDCK